MLFANTVAGAKHPSRVNKRVFRESFVEHDGISTSLVAKKILAAYSDSTGVLAIEKLITASVFDTSSTF